MTGLTDDSINKQANYDMASALTALSIFLGKDNEDIIAWLQQAKIISKVSMLSEKNTVKLLILRTKDIAQTWIAKILTGEPDLTLAEISTRMTTLFASNNRNQELLTKFINLNGSKTKEEYLTMLKLAITLHEKNFLEVVSLMKHTIMKSPTDVKSYLFQKGLETNDWYDFLKYAKESIWLCFETQSEVAIINKYEKRYSNNEKKNIGENGRKFCKFHGACNHNSMTCRILKEIETKGYILQKKKSNVNAIEAAEDAVSDDNLELNKTPNNSYFSVHTRIPTIFSHMSNNKNPFYIKASINNTETLLLLDTGADISLLSIDKLCKKDLKDMKPEKIRVQTATGEKLKILGSISNIKLAYKGKTYFYKAYIVDRPDFQIIIGADVSKNNLDFLFNTDFNYLKATDLKKLNNLATNQRENLVFAQFAELFQSEFCKYNLCTLTKH
ncbi:hypothetical protein BDAP_000800 [Binucleata daphniae]